MKKFGILLTVSGLLFLQALPASSQTKKAAAVHVFASADHAVIFQYSAPLLLCHENTIACQDYFNLCSMDQDTIQSIACLGYSGYKGYNFTGAALAIGIVNDAKDETACFALQGTKTADETINGVTFKTADDGDAGMGHQVEDFAYRAFDHGRCYAADLRIATTNFGNYDRGTVKEFKAIDEQKVHRKLKQVLESLQLAAAGAQ